MSDQEKHIPEAEELSAKEQYELLQAQSKELRKKMLKTAAFILLALVLVFGVMLILDFINQPTAEIPEGYYEFDPPYHTVDEATKLQYQTDYNDLAYDQHIIEYYHYGNPEQGGYREGITDANRGQMDAGVLFLCSWLDTVKNGDANAYNSCFSENYWEENEPEGIFKKVSFSPQMLYDINIALVSKKSDQGDQLVTYWVEYKILHNDGTFRRDIGSGISRRQDVTVRVRGDGSAVIEKLVTYRGLRNETVIGVIPVLIVIGAALVIAIIIIVFKKKAEKKRREATEIPLSDAPTQNELSTEIDKNP